LNIFKLLLLLRFYNFHIFIFIITTT